MLEAKLVIQVAGVFITENRIDCVIGDVVKDSVSRVGLEIPRTDNRIYRSINKSELSPVELINAAASWIIRNSKNIESIAIGCFGPFEDLDNETISKTGDYIKYGVLSDVPQYKGWAGTHIYHLFRGKFSDSAMNPIIRVYTDVDVAAYGEYWYLATRSGDATGNVPHYLENASLVFLSISRSINGGIAYKGDIWHGRHHPLMSIYKPNRYSYMKPNGQMWVDDYAGCCPFHGDCIEGLIGISALEERTKLDFDKIPLDDEELWDLVSYYIASLCVTVTGMLAPSRIVLGGRILREKTNIEFASKLVQMVRGHFYDMISASDPNFLREYAKRRPNMSAFTSPRYPELLNEDEFINLPAIPIVDGELRESMPGRHGALRLAVNQLMRSSKNGR